jgi:O-antigen ligase
MARKKKGVPQAAPMPARGADTPSAQQHASAISQRAGSGDAAGGTVVVVFALMMLLAPGLGVPHEEMLQDTLKSIIVSFCAIGGALLFFWEQRGRTEPLRWHPVMWMPLALMAYALGSMAWSHTYLGGVEAIRWFIFSLLLWLGLNTLSLQRLPLLALGIHAGAVVACLWAVLQFFFDLKLFPQGPHPASTFVNRNFLAEFVICTLPFAAMLLARARQSAQVALLSASTGIIILTILMTGTRGALIALWLQLLVIFPFTAWLYRRQFAFVQWSRATRWIAAAVLLGVVGGLGMVKTGDPEVVSQQRGLTALERGFGRTASIGPRDESLGIRMIMWKATGRMIQAHPIAGVGAGAWENEIPLYQAPGSQLETDYYVHNEFLQLLAEYGAVGWLFLLALAAYLIDATRRTLAGPLPQAQPEGPWRAALLCSLLALMIVSNVGFPWRVAATGALFALCLGGLAASDARLSRGARWLARPLRWRPAFSKVALAGMALTFALAAHISYLAAQAEHKIVRATKIALTISASGNPRDPRWTAPRAEMLKLIREGITITPHYRKITPMVADELARWGDWMDATWIWESVLSSRPYVVAIIANVARGYASLGSPGKALEYLQSAKKIQPNAPAVRSLEVLLMARTGQQAKALEMARAAFAEKIYDHDLANAAFALARNAGDYEFAAQAMRERMIRSPQSRLEGYLQLGNMYATQARDRAKAQDAFKRAMGLATPAQHAAMLPYIPVEYRAGLGLPAAAGAPAAPQTSASKG